MLMKFDSGHFSSSCIISGQKDDVLRAQVKCAVVGCLPPETSGGRDEAFLKMWAFLGSSSKSAEAAGRVQAILPGRLHPPTGPRTVWRAKRELSSSRGTLCGTLTAQRIRSVSSTPTWKGCGSPSSPWSLITPVIWLPHNSLFNLKLYHGLF